MSIDPVLMPTATSPIRDKVVTAKEAVRLVRDGDHLVLEGFAGQGFAEELVLALEERFLLTGTIAVGNGPIIVLTGIVVLACMRWTGVERRNALYAAARKRRLAPSAVALSQFAAGVRLSTSRRRTSPRSGSRK